VTGQGDMRVPAALMGIAAAVHTEGQFDIYRGNRQVGIVETQHVHHRYQRLVIRSPSRDVQEMHGLADIRSPHGHDGRPSYAEESRACSPK